MSAAQYEVSNDRELLRSRELILEDIAEYRADLARIDAEMRKRGLEIEPQGEPSDNKVHEVATAIYNVPAAPGAERENNLTWDESKWYARTALRAAGCAMSETEEWEYARVYYDEGGNPQVRKVQKSDIDAHRPDGHRSDGSPYWNYTPHRRRKAGTWEPVAKDAE